MNTIKTLAHKALEIIRQEGLSKCLEKGYQKTKRVLHKNSKSKKYAFKDVLFISGCGASVPHPHRYRVTHQREQLALMGIESDEVYVTELTLDQLRYYRVFIFFRCPCIGIVESFIAQAKQLHKTVLFDVDDLVIDTKYTDQIPFVAHMSEKDKRGYDEGVESYGKTLRLCEGACTTTERLAEELGKYTPEVFINRNTASEKMVELSQRAIYFRDVLPTLKITPKMNRVQCRQCKWAKKEALKRQSHGLTLAYFSGSITHNDDFKMITPAVKGLMERDAKVELLIVGELTLSSDMEPFCKRIRVLPFLDWKELPGLIASVDINLAPLETGIFNEAKSENKWVEAALVKVPTIASRIGAFEQMIVDGETGVLCQTQQEWVDALEHMASDEAWRKQIAQNAYCYCMEHCVTAYTGMSYAKYLREHMRPNILMVLPSLDISGGVLVALRHCEILQSAGYDVTVLADTAEKWAECEGHRFPTLRLDQDAVIGRVDCCVETVWFTQQTAEKLPNVGKRRYLVQGFETDFYAHGDNRLLLANQTYSPKCDTSFITISKWCQRWLLERYGQHAAFAPNGISCLQFYPTQRSFSGKIRILVEGDYENPIKNIEESLTITDQLDSSRFEVWHLTYQATNKKHRVDRVFSRIPYAEVANLYRECHILLKSSTAESFSYPPLEMLATGGYVVALLNDGNREYLVEGENCMTYPLGNEMAAIKAIEQICCDEALRNRLWQGGQKIAKARDWKNIAPQVLALYGTDDKSTL